MRISEVFFKILKGGYGFAAVVLFAAGLLQATPVTYTFTGSGTGSLGTTDFSDANFVVTLTSDTSNVAFQASLSAQGIIGLPVDIDITGVGTVDFNPTTFIFVAGDEVGFGQDNPVIPNLPGNLIQITDATNLTGYDLTTDVTASGGNSILPQFVNADTSGGALSFTSMSTVTFNADVAAVPEPSTLALLGGALMGLAFLKRRSSSRRWTS